MRVLPGDGIIGITKTNLFCELLDGRFGAGEEMPAFSRARPPVTFQVTALFGCCQPASFPRINAHAEHRELLADAPLHLLQRFDQTVECNSAKHRALVVPEQEDDRLVAEKVAELDRLAVFIAKAQIERNLLL